MIVEDLTKNIKSKYKNKQAKHKLNNWMKGYLQERIEFKSFQYNIAIKHINAAYTSQICSNCGYFLGKRSTSNIFHCPSCDKGVNVHYNSAMNIKNRFNDNEIKLNTNYLVIRSLLLDRNKRMLEFKTEPSKTLVDV